MFVVKIDDRKFTLSEETIKHFVKLQELSDKNTSHDEGYITYNHENKTFVIDMDPSIFGLFVNAVRKNSMEHITHEVGIDSEKVGFTGLVSSGGYQVLSENSIVTDDDANSTEIVLTEFSEHNQQGLKDSSKIFLKNIRKSTKADNPTSSIGFTEGASTVAHTTESYIKPRRVLVNE